jgi:transcriptional regulator NrdR family protein
MRVIRPENKPESYSRAKLFSSIYSVFENALADAATIDAVTDTVESKILDTEKSELTPGEIAEIVLKTLKHYNTSAFVRYLTYQTDLLSPAQLKAELKKY